MILKRHIEKIKCYCVNAPLIIMAFFLLLLTSCGSTKDVTEQSNAQVDVQFKETFHEAIREKMMGNFDKAIILFEKCLMIDNSSSASNYALSDIYQFQGDKSKAIFYGEKAYELEKSNKWYTLNLAYLYFDMGHYHKSAEYFALGIDDNEKNTDLKFKYAEALIFSNQHQKAIDLMDEIEIETGKIPELSLTKHDLYLEIGEEEKAQKELDELMAANPDNSDYKLVVAEYFMKTSQLDKAGEIANDIINTDTTVGSAYIILADIALRNGDLNKAFNNLESGFRNDGVAIDRKLELIWSLVPYAFLKNEDAQLIERRLTILFEMIYDPTLKSDLLHSYYGVFLKDQGKLEESLAQFKLATRLNSGVYNYWMQLLNLEYEIEEYEDLATGALLAIEIFPSQPMFYLLAGIGSYESEQYDSANEWLYLGKDLVVKDNELLAEFLYHIGKVSCLVKDYSAGYTFFEQSKLKFPSGIKVYNAKALFLMEEGKIEEAEKEIIAALDKMPINPNLLDTYGLIYMSKKDYLSATIKFQKALLNSPNDALIMEHFGDALFLNGEKVKALEMWNKAKVSGNESELLLKKIADNMYYEN